MWLESDLIEADKKLTLATMDQRFNLLSIFMGTLWTCDSEGNPTTHLASTPILIYLKNLQPLEMHEFLWIVISRK